VYFKFFIFTIVKSLNDNDIDDEETDLIGNLPGSPTDENMLLDDNLKLFSRSKTLPTSALRKNFTSVNKSTNSNGGSSSNVNTDRLKNAREEAERAIKVILILLFEINIFSFNVTCYFKNFLAKEDIYYNRTVSGIERSVEE